MRRNPPRQISSTHSSGLARAEPARMGPLDVLQSPKFHAAVSKRLGGRIAVDEFIAVVAGQLQSNRALASCRTDTLFAAIYEAAQLGLRPDPTLQHCFLVPYAGKCKLILGYRGMILLATSGGDSPVTKVEADIVYEGDEFHQDRGLRPDLVHRPRLTRSADEQGGPLAAYAVVHMRNAEPTFKVVPWWKIRELQGNARGGPWVDHVEAMAKKTAIRKALNYVPLAPIAASALVRDEYREEGGPELDAPLEGSEPEPEAIEAVAAERPAPTEVDEREFVAGVDLP